MSPAFELQLGSLGWAPTLPALVALVLLAVVVLLATLRAWRRLGDEPAARRWGVAALNGAAFLAMAALLAPPTLERDRDATVQLVTQGAIPGADDSLTREDFVLGAATGVEWPDLQALQTAGQLTLRRPDLGSVDVLGHGLPPEAWAALPADLGVTFDPPPLEGLVRPRWTRVLVPGEALVVSGEVRLQAAGMEARQGKRVELRLVDPAGVTVSSTFARDGDAFSLQAVPRAPGALEYRLQMVEDDAVLANEPVATFVQAGAGARLLVLQSAPSFETRQLAAWATDRGHPLVARSQVSRDRDLVQGINLPEDAGTDLAPALLEATDLAVVDGRRWAEMDTGARQQILDAVRGGLGLMLLADEPLAAWLDDPPNAGLAGARLEPTPRPDPVWLAWPGATPERPLPLAPYRLVPASAQPLTRGESGEWIETWQSLGSGRIAVSLLRERHRWATAGERSDFSRYWTRALQELARPAERPRWASPGEAGLARAGTRLMLCAQLPGGSAGVSGAIQTTPVFLRITRRAGSTATAAGPAPDAQPGPIADPDSESEPARAVTLLPHDWGVPLACGHAWPSAPGWHRLELLGAEDAVLDGIDLRVFASGEWQTAEFERRQAATRSRVTERTAPAVDRRVGQPVSPWWAWGVLLLAGGALWAERRLFELA